MFSIEDIMQSESSPSDPHANCLLLLSHCLLKTFDHPPQSSDGDWLDISIPGTDSILHHTQVREMLVQ